MRIIVSWVVLLVLEIVVVGIFVWSGTYNIGADAPHWPATIRVIDMLRDNSIARRDANESMPNLEDPTLIAEGAMHYEKACTGCHLAPGMDNTEMRQGLYPQPPDLAKTGIDDPKEAFWFIKHGIKMSAMPAWGLTHDDKKIWSFVAFVRKLPQMTALQYRALTTSPNGEEKHEHDSSSTPTSSDPASAQQSPHNNP